MPKPTFLPYFAHLFGGPFFDCYPGPFFNYYIQFDSNGATISSTDCETFAQSGSFVAMSEMMNVPGVIYGDIEVVAKLNIAKKYNLPIDGHAPDLNGEELNQYAQAGITTDHECFSVDEHYQK